MTVLSVPGEDSLVRCKWAPQGCPWILPRDIVGQHEESCPHKLVFCPALHRGTCQWQGSILRMADHVRQGTCVQIVTCTREIDQYVARARIGDYRMMPNLTVFDMTRTVNWKPVMILNSEVAQFLIHLTFQRTGAGLWFIIIRSYSPEDVLKQITVKLEVYKKEDAISGCQGSSRVPQQVYTYEGGVLPNHIPNLQAMLSGKLLLLNDGQVKLLKNRETIFEYKITISATQREQP